MKTVPAWKGLKMINIYIYFWKISKIKYLLLESIQFHFISFYLISKNFILFGLKPYIYTNGSNITSIYFSVSDSKDDLADVYSQTPKCDIPEGDNVSYESWGTIWDDETDDEDQVNSGTDYDNVAGEGTSVADISLDQGMGEKASLAEGMEEDAHEPEEEEEGEAKREDFDFYFWIQIS